MATHRIPILGFNALPDTSGSVFFEPYPIKATNDTWRHGHWIFNDTTTNLELYGVYDVPLNYVAGASGFLKWTASSTNGNVVWSMSYRVTSGNDAVSLDQTGSTNAVLVNASAPTTINLLMQTALPFTATDFKAGDTVEYKLVRVGTSAAETLAAAAQVVRLLFEYTDS